MAAYKAAGIDAHGYVADVSDEDAVNTMVAKGSRPRSARWTFW